MKISGWAFVAPTVLLLTACGSSGGDEKSSAASVANSTAVSSLVVQSSAQNSSNTISSVETSIASSLLQQSSQSSRSSTANTSAATSSTPSASSNSSAISQSSVQISSVISSQSLSAISSSRSSSVVFSSSSSSSSFAMDLSVDCKTGVGSNLYVNSAYAGAENGSQVQPFKTLQAAIDSATNGSLINVAEGTYNESIEINSLIHLCGGWASDFSVRNPELYPSVIQASNATAISMVNSANTSVVGFTIRNSKLAVNVEAQAWPPTRNDSDPLLAGNIIENNGATSMTRDLAGGIIMDGGFITLTKNIIRNNKGSYGSAIRVDGEEAVLQGNIIQSNQGGSDHGGAVYSAVDDIYMYKNLIKGNEVGVATAPNYYGWGGGMIILGQGDLQGNIWTENYSPSHGGALFVDETAKVKMSNELFYNNICSLEGGEAIALDGGSEGRSELIATNITVVEAHQCNSVSAILLESKTDLILKNSIIWSPIGTIDIHFQEVNATVNVTYSNFRTISGEDNSGNVLIQSTNINADPLFADPANHDYHLKSTAGRYNSLLDLWEIDSTHSPAIDAGDPASNYSEETSPNGGRINQGAYGNTMEASQSQ